MGRQQWPAAAAHAKCSARLLRVIKSSNELAAKHQKSAAPCNGTGSQSERIAGQQAASWHFTRLAASLPCGQGQPPRAAAQLPRIALLAGAASAQGLQGGGQLRSRRYAKRHWKCRAAPACCAAAPADLMHAGRAPAAQSSRCIKLHCCCTQCTAQQPPQRLPAGCGRRQARGAGP